MTTESAGSRDNSGGEAVAGDSLHGAGEPWMRHGLRGFFMGAADVVPGVSGGTIALVLGIYTRFIDALKALNLALLGSAWRAVVGGRDGRREFGAALRVADTPFLVVLGVGIGLALVLGSHAILFVLERFPVPVAALFFGLILASVRVPWRLMRVRGPTQVLLLVAGAVAAYFLVGLQGLAAPSALWFVPVAGAVAICAMLLPGISGSALLLLMGMYERVLAAVRDLDLTVLGLFAGGALVGLVVASRGLSWLLHHRRDGTLAVLVGLMVGSLRRVWPFKEGGDGFAQGVNVWPDSWGLAVTGLLAMVAGVGVLWLLHRWSDRGQTMISAKNNP